VGANLFIGNLDPVSCLILSKDAYENMNCFVSFNFAAKSCLFCFLQGVDEKLLHDTFSAFGVIVTNPKVIISLCLLL
jgi:hypothetical protein